MSWLDSSVPLSLPTQVLPFGGLAASPQGRHLLRHAAGSLGEEVLAGSLGGQRGFIRAVQGGEASRRSTNSVSDGCVSDFWFNSVAT